jgi:uncharacterized membrane protein YbhN (UPF0104 family)
VTQIGRLLVVLGLALAAAGALLIFSERLPFRIGRLPGDIVVRGKNSTFYLPLATSLLLSVVLSLILWLMNRR